MIEISDGPCRPPMPKRLRLAKFRLGESVKVLFDYEWRKGKIVSIRFNEDWKIEYAVQCSIDAWWGLEKDVKGLTND